MNVLFPMTGPNRFADDVYLYPKPLIEIGPDTMLEAAVKSYQHLDGVDFHVALAAADVREFNLDSVLRRVFEPRKVGIKVLSRETSGALCTALLLADSLEDDRELLIVNYDQYLGFNVAAAIDFFRKESADFGLVGFDSAHPKWSYVRLNSSGEVVEAAEKRPISRNALVGVYYFRHASLFKSAAKSAVLNAPVAKDKFYVSESINSAVLSGARGKLFEISRDQYRKFYDGNEVRQHIESKRAVSSSEATTRKFVMAINNRDDDEIMALLADGVLLHRPTGRSVSGKREVCNLLSELLPAGSKDKLSIQSIIVSGSYSVLEFNLGECVRKNAGCYIIEWNSGKISAVRAYYGSYDGST